MTRECKTDFTELAGYIDTYSISSNLQEKSYIECLKVIHKCYFSLITWNAEILHNKDLLQELYPDCSDETCTRISEAFSDMGTASFNWINGSYKASRILQRVAIENFIRAIGTMEDKSLLLEKNVFTLFERANKLSVFNLSIHVKASYNQLHTDYKILCEDIHTAKADNMEHMSTLAGLPVFKKSKAKITKDMYKRSSQNFNLILCTIFNGFFHRLHHRNRENILHSLNKDQKPNILISSQE